MIRNGVKATLVLSTLFAGAGCATKTQTGALAGGAGGALIGGLIGSGSHARAGEGALIGGAIGAIGGGLVGHAADKEDEKREADRRSYEQARERNYYSASSTQRPAPAYNAPRAAVTQADVIAWSARGTKDDIIIDRIEQSGTRFYLTAADENHLRDNGVSPDVIRSMKETGRR